VRTLYLDHLIQTEVVGCHELQHCSFKRERAGCTADDAGIIMKGCLKIPARLQHVWW